MIIDISDPEIANAYQSIVKDGSKDWLIVAYSKVSIVPFGYKAWQETANCFARHAMPSASLTVGPADYMLYATT
jgi:hypothetical protein